MSLFYRLISMTFPNDLMQNTAPIDCFVGKPIIPPMDMKHCQCMNTNERGTCICGRTGDEILDCPLEISQEEFTWQAGKWIPDIMAGFQMHHTILKGKEQKDDFTAYLDRKRIGRVYKVEQGGFKDQWRWTGLWLQEGGAPLGHEDTYQKAVLALQAAWRAIQQ